MKSRYILSTCLALALSTSACTAKDTPTSSSDTSALNKATAITADLPSWAHAPDAAWRELDPDNTLYIDTEYGRMVIELYPEIAPIHVERIKTLTQQKFYDYITFHRVIEGFMNQTGDPKGDGTGDSDLPNIQAEFTFRRDPSMPITLVGARALVPGNPNAGMISVGFYKNLPVATQPAEQAIMTKDGKVKAFGLHCKGVMSMARAQDPNSANSQFFLMRATADHLNTNYSIWGTTVFGQENLTKIKVGTVGQDEGFVPDKMIKVRLAADVPEEERLNIKVLKTSSPAFKNHLRSLKGANDEYPDVCDVDIPSKLVTP